MKKLVGGLAVSLVLLVGATACGGGDDASSGASTTAPGAPGAAAAGGADSGSGAAAAPAVSDGELPDVFCAAVDELLDATKKMDDARKEAARKKVMALSPQVQQLMAKDRAAAAKLVTCFMKAQDPSKY